MYSYFGSIVGKEKEKKRLESNILVLTSYNEGYSRVTLDATDKGEQS